MPKISTNAFIIFSGDAITRFMNFLITIHLARVLDKENFGMVIIGLSTLAYSMWLADLGLVTCGTREMAKPPDKRSFHLGDVLFLKFFLSGIVFVIMQVILFLLYSDPTLEWVVRIYMLCLFTDALMLEWYFKAIRKYAPITITRLISNAVFLLLIFALVRASDQVTLVPVIYFLINLAAVILLFLMKQRNDTFVASKLFFHKITFMLKQSIVIGMGALFANVVQFLPPIIIGIFYASSEAGIYGSAMKIIALLLMIDRIFFALFLPAMSNKWITQREKINDQLSLILKLIIIGSFSLSTILTIFAHNIIILLFGEAYSGAVGILMILSWFITATMLNSVFSLSLIAIGKDKFYFQSSIIGGTVSTILILILTYYQGIFGAAAAIVVGEVLTMLIMYTKFKMQFSVNILKPLLIAAICAIVVILFAQILSISQLWLMPFVWILFVGLAFIFKGYRKDDLIWLVTK